jgi:hypothetical protein
MPIDTSAQIGIARIGELEIGLVMTTITESVGVVDSIPSKHKIAVKSFVEAIGAIDILKRFYRPFYLKLGGLLTNLITVTAIDGGNNLALQNVVSAKWDINNTWLGLRIPYGKIKWQQINSYKGDLVLFCTNIDSMLSVFGATMSYNPQTTKRNPITISIVAQKTDGNFVNFTFYNCLINNVELPKLTERVSESYFTVKLTYTGFMESG